MQQLQPECLCGQPMEFPPNQDESHCKTDGCGVLWKREKDGCWAEGLTKWIFTPMFTKQKLNHYQKLMKWRDSSLNKAKIPRGNKRSGSKH